MKIRKIVMVVGLTLCSNTVIAQEMGLLPDTRAVDSHLLPDTQLADSLTLSLPPLTSRGTIAHYLSPGSFFAGYADWSLHRGLNASLSLSAIFGTGRHSGSGFANSYALMYADNITPKLSFALGGYYSFLDYSSHQMRDAGLTAMLSYRFDEHWEASAFVQKSAIQPRIPPHLYWMADDVGDKIGASLRYNFNPAFSVSISVWNETHP